MDDILEKLENYKRSSRKDLELNEINIYNTVYRIPQIKHFWIGKYVDELLIMKSLEEKRELLVENEMKKVSGDIDGILTTATKTKILKKSKSVREIDKQIENQELLLLYLKELNSTFAYITNDVRNCVNLIQSQNI